MKLLPVLFAITVLVCLSSATSTADCADTASSCIDSCCGGVSGQLTSGGCIVPPVQNNQYYSCVNTCNANGLECIAPGSPCTQQYRTCVSHCTGTGTALENCRLACLDTGYKCAQAASGGSGCCGSSFILLFAGVLGLALFASKR